MRNFKFFHGYINTLTAVWMPETDGRDYYGLDVEQELTRTLSRQIADEIDEDIIRTITRRINGGDNHGIDYLNHWLRIGDNRA